MQDVLTRESPFDRLRERDAREQSTTVTELVEVIVSGKTFVLFYPSFNMLRGC